MQMNYCKQYVLYIIYMQHMLITILSASGRLEIFPKYLSRFIIRDYICQVIIITSGWYIVVIHDVIIIQVNFII